MSFENSSSTSVCAKPSSIVTSTACFTSRTPDTTSAVPGTRAVIVPRPRGTRASVPVPSRRRPSRSPSTPRARPRSAGRSPATRAPSPARSSTRPSPSPTPTCPRARESSAPPSHARTASATGMPGSSATARPATSTRKRGGVGDAGAVNATVPCVTRIRGGSPPVRSTAARPPISIVAPPPRSRITRAPGAVSRVISPPISAPGSMGTHETPARQALVPRPPSGAPAGASTDRKKTAQGGAVGAGGAARRQATTGEASVRASKAARERDPDRRGTSNLRGRRAGAGS